MAAEETVTLAARVPKRLIEKLDEQAQALGVTRAALSRMLLEQALGEDVQLAVLQETYYRLAPVIRTVMPKALQAAYASIPELINDELRKTPDGELLADWDGATE